MRYVLAFACNDRPGVVAAVATRIAVHGGNIMEAQQFEDRATGRFFMRVVFSLTQSVEDFTGGLTDDVRRFGLEWTLRTVGVKRRVLILVSKFDHCLVDLLYRVRIGELNMDCVGVVSNHARHDVGGDIGAHIPFHHFPVGRDGRSDQEARIKALVEESGAELVILARYMQILSDDMCAYLSGRCINIHHSFLPGFKGARPYHQAYDRGVKMIGATAHYVTGELDEGPIISQDVEHISHVDVSDDLVRKGRDIERRVLARAVSWHLDDRVFLNGRKTVVFA